MEVVPTLAALPLLASALAGLYEPSLSCSDAFGRFTVRRRQSCMGRGAGIAAAGVAVVAFGLGRAG